MSRAEDAREGAFQDNEAAIADALLRIADALEALASCVQREQIFRETSFDGTVKKVTKNLVQPTFKVGS